MLLVVALLAATVSGSLTAHALESESFLSRMTEKFSEENLPMEDRPQVRWWLAQGYHSDETIVESIEDLYELGYGGVELLCLTAVEKGSSLYGWGSEEWYNDMKLVVETCGRLGMSVSFAAGPNWQPSFPYYGTNTDVAGNSSLSDYYDDYAILRENGRNVLEAAYASGTSNVNYYIPGNSGLTPANAGDEGAVLTLDPNVDVFNQGLGMGITVANDEGKDENVSVWVKAGETVQIDLTSYTYVSAAAGGGGFPGGPGGPPPMMAAETEPTANLMGTNVARQCYTVGFENFETISVAKAAAENAVEVTLDGVTQFTESQLTPGTADSLITVSENNEGDTIYTFTWTAPEGEGWYVLTPSWRIGVGSGTEADTFDYGYMIMMNHFTTSAADAVVAFWQSYLLDEEMVSLFEKYDMNIDYFLDSWEVSKLGNYYWSNEMSDIFQDLHGYDVTPYLPYLFDDELTLTDGISMDAVKNDMQAAMTEAHIIFLERLSENFHNVYDNMGIRVQPGYGSDLTTSNVIRAVDVPETESLAFKFSVESFKLMSGGVHLSGANEFSSETNNWLGVDYASYSDQMYVVHQQMAAGVNRTVWHGYETLASNEKSLSWPNNSGGIGCQFGSVSIPTSTMESDYSYHITLLQNVLKTGVETVDIGIMQNGYYGIKLWHDGDSKGLLTFDHTLQDEGYTWECFDSSYLYAEDGIYGFQNEDGTLGHPKYQAVVVYDEDLDLNAAKALLKLAQNGLPVVFLTDSAAATTASEAAADADLAPVVAQIKALDNVAVAESTEDIVNCLHELGVVARVGLVNAVSDQCNSMIYEEALAAGVEYLSYDGIWTLMLRDDEEAADYHYFFNESEEYTIDTTVTLQGEVVPYVLNTWTGEIVPMAEYCHVDGTTVFDISMAPTTVAVVLADRTGSNVHVVETDAAVAMNALGEISLRAEESGEYTAVLSSGETVSAQIDVPSIQWSGDWTVSIESWSQGEKTVYAQEVRDNIDPYTGETFTVNGETAHTTTEYYYITDKQTVADRVHIANDAMVSWKDLYANGLVDTDLKAVSGTGVYATTFTLPEDWNLTQDGLTLDLGYMDSMVSVEVNGQKFRVDIDNCVLDITDALRAGRNTLKVYVATDLCNYTTGGSEGLKRGMQESAPYYPLVYRSYPAPYGLTEPVSLIPYSTVPVTGVTVSLTGPEAVTMEGNLVYGVTVEDASNLATATISVAIPAEPEINAAEGWYVIASEYVDGVLSVVIGNNAGITTDEAVEILTLTAANPREVVNFTVTLEEAVLSAYVGDAEAFLGTVYGNTAVTTAVDYSIYDVNQDGTVNQLDITRAQRFYGTADELADVDNDGEVNIDDLILILNNYS